MRRFTLSFHSLGQLVLTLSILSPSAFAVTKTEKPKTQVVAPRPRFISSLSELKASLSLPATEKITNLEVPLKTIRKRIQTAKTDKRIEPISIYVDTKDPKDLDNVVSTLAADQHLKEFRAKLLKKIPTGEKQKNNAKVRVELDESDLDFLNPEAIAKLMSRPHHQVTVQSTPLFQQKEERREFFNQLKPFLSKNMRKKIWEKMSSGENLIVDKDLLPSFARRMVGKYVAYRGPNCFHAALSFHGQRLTQSPAINFKEEKGYHRAMINYDELWRAINQHFYEVDTKNSPLKYGDMIVFFNIASDPTEPMNFKWIRHTATYLFDSYTFSKGSKSPDTPYSVKTLGEEWETWRNYTDKLGVKIYRRKNRQIKDLVPYELTDWIY